ncbi:MAG: cytochrome c [Lentisphaeraceae bacterium]|nr:cytochrome c [Lentisphaeraceae bacterium]
MRFQVKVFFTLSIAFILSTYAQTNSLIKLSPSPQRSGDAIKGKDYLINGSYISSGIPLKAFKLLKPKNGANLLGREGVNGTLPYKYTSVKAPNGIDIVVPNCLTCHASSINGNFILGLGNPSMDFSADRSLSAKAAGAMISTFFGPKSKEVEAFSVIHKVYSSIGANLMTKGPGLNPADRLAYLLFAHRDPKTLEWLEKPRVDLSMLEEISGTDIPPLWNIKKKHALYYTASGQGDFVRLIMSSSLLTIDHIDEMAEIEKSFIDTLEYLKTIEPPKFPGVIDEKLSLKGRAIYEDNCKKCHGTYGEKPTYPNLVVKFKKIGTDPALAESLVKYSKGGSTLLISQSDNPAKVLPQLGYIAPPLDGIWATAPFLHNASVPDLNSLLNSSTRPKKWTRGSRYDLENNVGWSYSQKQSQKTYDTSLKGNSNQGHTFGDDLTDDERVALIEYLKTL